MLQCAQIFLATLIETMTTPHNEAQIKQAAALIRAGRFEEAKALVITVLKNDPNNAPAWYLSSLFYIDIDKRRQVLQRALTIDPGYELARKALENLEPQEGVVVATPLQKTRSWTNSVVLAGIAVAAIVVVVFFVLLMKRGSQPPVLPTSNSIASLSTPSAPATMASKPPSTPAPIGTSALILGTITPRPTSPAEAVVYIKTTKGLLNAILDSPPGQYIGAGKGRIGFTSKADITVQQGEIYLTSEPTQFTDWSFRFYAPVIRVGEIYQIPTYAHDRHLPNITVEGTGRACDETTGSFEVERQGKVLVISFQQICDNDPKTVLKGTLRFTDSSASMLTATVARAQLVNVAPSTGNVDMSMISGLEDPIGKGPGSGLTRGPGEARSVNGALMLKWTETSTNSVWSLTAYAPEMEIGRQYDALPTASSTNRDQPFLSVSSNGHTCSLVSGQFKVEQAWPKIIISFWQDCEGSATQSLTGTLTYEPDEKFIATATLPPDKIFVPNNEDGHLTVRLDRLIDDTRVMFDGPAKLAVNGKTFTFTVTRPEKPDEEWAFTFLSLTNQIENGLYAAVPWTGQTDARAMLIKSPYTTATCKDLRQGFRIVQQVPVVTMYFEWQCDGKELDGQLEFNRASSPFSTAAPGPEAPLDLKTVHGKASAALQSSLNDPLGNGFDNFEINGPSTIEFNNGTLHLSMGDNTMSAYEWNYYFRATPLLAQHVYKDVRQLATGDNSDRPTMRIGTSRAACDTVDGEFSITELPSSIVVITFVHDCGPDHAKELKGTITFTPESVYAPTPSIVPEKLVSFNATKWKLSADLYSAPGDPIAGGKGSFTLDAPVRLFYDNHALAIDLSSGGTQAQLGTWRFRFYAPALVWDQHYVNATRYPSNPGNLPGMFVDAPDHGCNRVLGDFTIEQQGEGLIVAFTQQCEEDPQKILKGTLTLTPDK